MSIEQKKELLRKIGLFGLSDLRKIAPIGDLGYLGRLIQAINLKTIQL